MSFFNLLRIVMARKKNFVRVCSSTPKGDVRTTDTQVLKQLISEQQAAIAREPNTRKMAQRALELGDLCLSSGCPMKAIQVWRDAALRLGERDCFWVDEPINPDFVRFDDLVSAKEARTLGRRIDRVWRLLGHPEMATWSRGMKKYYEDLWLDKYYEALP